MTKLAIPLYGNEIVLEGKQTQELNQFFENMATKIDFLEELTGTGPPDGIVEAIEGKKYRDTSGTASTIIYVKNLNEIGGDTTLGWILV